MDVMEARTDQTLDLTVQWRLSNWTKSHNEREIFTKVTIQMVGEEENKVDIWIMRGEKTIDVLANNTFQVWSEQDINFIEWRDLFR